jgi:NAD(P)-dependent dehydrogenase (short-subunit alcohol dehydrogenase family)
VGAVGWVQFIRPETHHVHSDGSQARAQAPLVNFHLKPLSGQAMVITGASSGIGLVTARKAARAGAKVLLVSRNGPVLERICQEIRAAGGQADYAVADVGDEAQVRAASDRAIALFGGYDAWVNVAGVAIYAPLDRTPRDEHERLFRTNYWGVVNGCLTALEHLRERGGAIITVGSITSDMPAPILGAYTASKHAAKGFVDSLRIELLAERAPVSLTLVKPSGIATPLNNHAANHLPGKAQIPPPAYAPELVADAILNSAVHPRREITVGGIGRQQAMFAAHFPHLGDRLSVLVTPLLHNQKRPDVPTNNLFGPSDNEAKGGSDDTPAIPFSPYTSIRLHKGAAVAAAAAGFALVVLGGAFRRR